MLFAQYLPSALSTVATRYLREHVFVASADHSSRASNVDVSRPERCSLWWESFSAHAFGVCFFELCRFLIFIQRSSGFTLGNSCTIF